MVGLTGHRHLELRRAHDRAYDGEWRSRGLENRALLDVQLDECVDIVARGRGDPRGIETALTHCGGDFGVYGIGCACDRSRPPEVRREARAFFLADRDDLERAPRFPLGFEQRLDGREPSDDAEGAVEPAAVADRIDVGSGNDALSFISAFRSTPQI